VHQDRSQASRVIIPGHARIATLNSSLRADAPVEGVKAVAEEAGDRIGWLRAAVLGANEGIVSTASLIIGVAAASGQTKGIVVAGLSGFLSPLIRRRLRVLGIGAVDHSFLSSSARNKTGLEWRKDHAPGLASC
jgi:hypothetical protein